MAQIDPLWLEHQRRRRMPPKAEQWIGPQPPGWMRPSSKLFLSPRPEGRKDSADPATDSLDLAAEREELLQLRGELDALKAEIKFRQLLRDSKAYNPNQPRVPAGSSDGGQWTNDGGVTGTRLAAADKPGLGPGIMAAIAAQAAKRLIEAYRSENGLWDLFGRKDGTVTTTKINGLDVFGSNSNSPTYTRTDRAAAIRMRETLLEKYPDAMKTDNIGHRPNDALFHAETTVLLRAARENGGALAGQTLEVFADNPMCRSCRTVLPYIGLELGNPTVTFVGLRGPTRTMRNGAWVD